MGCMHFEGIKPTTSTVAQNPSVILGGKAPATYGNGREEKYMALFSSFTFWFHSLPFPSLLTFFFFSLFSRKHLSMREMKNLIYIHRHGILVHVMSCTTRSAVVNADADASSLRGSFGIPKVSPSAPVLFGIKHLSLYIARSISSVFVALWAALDEDDGGVWLCGLRNGSGRGERGVWAPNGKAMRLYCSERRGGRTVSLFPSVY